MVIKGSYCLCIEVGDSIKIRIGSLGFIDFMKGYYVYVGSALTGLEQRITRHFKVSKGEHSVTHWHIDYLLKDENARINSVFIKSSEVSIECEISISEKMSGLGTPVKNFGSSDCRCGSHLYIIESCEVVHKLGLEHFSIKG